MFSFLSSAHDGTVMLEEGIIVTAVRSTDDNVNPFRYILHHFSEELSFVPNSLPEVVSTNHDEEGGSLSSMTTLSRTRDPSRVNVREGKQADNDRKTNKPQDTKETVSPAKKAQEQHRLLLQQQQQHAVELIDMIDAVAPSSALSFRLAKAEALNDALRHFMV